MRGFTPAPHKGHRPLTQLRKWLAGRTGIVPPEHTARRYPFEKKIEILRAGGGTATHPRAGRQNAAVRMLCVRGKRKKGRRRKLAFSPGFFHVFIAPVGTAFHPASFMRKQACFPILPHRRLGAGMISLPRGTGGEEPPAPFPSPRSLHILQLLLFFSGAVLYNEEAHSRKEQHCNETTAD